MLHAQGLSHNNAITMADKNEAMEPILPVLGDSSFAKQKDSM